LAYERATIIDRDLTPGTTIRAAVGTAAGFGTATAPAHHVLSKYPDPPAGIARDAAVELMFKTFCLYRENRMKLGDAANFCLTVLEEYSGADKDQRRAAAQRYAVAKKSILNTLATLAAEKGGPDHARKPRGVTKPFTAAERAWLEEAIKRLILRAAEVAGNPSATLRQITMTDLPPL
jgi:hypothetical protein